MMKNTLFAYTLIAALGLFLACSKKSDDTDPGTTGKTVATLKLSRGGQVVTQFETSTAFFISANAYTITFESKENISSGGAKHSIVFDVQANKAGTYPFINSTQSLTDGKANFLYQSYDLPP